MDAKQQYNQAFLAEDRSGELVCVIAVLAILETLFMILFFMSRTMNHTAKGWDVYLMIPAYMCFLGFTAILAVMIKYGGLGRHRVALEPENVITFIKLDLAMKLIYLTLIALPRLAILYLYSRIFTIKHYRYAIYFIGSIVVLTSVAGGITLLAICEPIAYNWDRNIPGGHCGDIVAGYRYIGFPNLLADVLILALPIYGVWGLQTKLVHKVGIIVTFLAGSLGTIAAIIRTTYFFQFQLPNDMTWHTVGAQVWIIVEPGVYFIAATLPSLRPILRYIFEDIKFSTMGHSILDRCGLGNSAPQSPKCPTKTLHRRPAIKQNTTTVSTSARPSGLARFGNTDAAGSSEVYKDETELENQIQ